MTVTIMMFMACLITYVLRLNMGFALVCMVKEKPQYYVDELTNVTENVNVSWTTLATPHHEEVDVCKGGVVKSKKHGREKVRVFLFSS